ncbi:MAG TPA: TlpA disulfide reductase family protein [Pedobacter sp.]
MSKIANVSMIKNQNIWGTLNKADSILWVFPVQTDTQKIVKPLKKRSRNDSSEQISAQLNQVMVLENLVGDSVKLSLLKRYNPYLDSEIVLSYNKDSLMKWTIDNVPPDVIRKTTITFSVSTVRPKKKKYIDVYMIPLKIPGIVFNDKRLNEIPILTVILSKAWVANLQEGQLYAIIETVTGKHTPTFKVKEKSQFHRDKIDSGITFKASYSLSDTIPVGRKLFRIDSVGQRLSEAFLTPIETARTAFIPTAYFSKLAPYFSDEKEYLVLDFWGTWCVPCIAALPHLRQLHERFKDRFGFLSICFDKAENFSKAEDIFSANDATWPQILDDQSKTETFRAALEVSAFPTYMVVDRTGKIVLSDFGTQGFDSLQKVLSNIP